MYWLERDAFIVILFVVGTLVWIDKLTARPT